MRNPWSRDAAVPSSGREILTARGGVGRKLVAVENNRTRSRAGELSGGRRREHARVSASAGRAPRVINYRISYVQATVLFTRRREVTAKIV
jgi:hypothetical protein